MLLEVHVWDPYPHPNLARRDFFCFDANNEDGAVEIELMGTRNETEAESNCSSAIMPTNPNPEDFLTVGFVECSFAVAKWPVWINITECSTSLLRKCLHFCIVQIQMFEFFLASNHKFRSQIKAQSQQLNTKSWLAYQHALAHVTKSKRYI